MLPHLDIAHMLFLDIECVSNQPSYADLSDTMKAMWAIKGPSAVRRYGEQLDEEELAAAYTDKAGIFAEFGKIVCISVGIVHRAPDGKLHVRLKSFADRDEAVLLREFCSLVTHHYNNPNKRFFCGHNIKEFDMPYICRRLVINQLPLPETLQVAGKKPWETAHFVDTMELWKFGDRKNYTSLKLLAAVLGFPSPKDDIDGSEVGRVFWEEDDLERIAQYCEKDVLATIQLFLKYRMQPLLEEAHVKHV